MIDGLVIIRLKVFPDERGFFLESYQKERYAALGVKVDFVQDNHSYSKKGVVRGMHFQKSQGKLIYCPRGKIYDVAVDIRRGSPTFGKWFGVVLDGEKHDQLYIPDGFAHGFCVLSDEAHVMYKVTSFYDAAKERGFRFDDPEVGIDWPLTNPLLSERDKQAKWMKDVV